MTTFHIGDRVVVFASEIMGKTNGVVLNIRPGERGRTEYLVTTAFNIAWQGLDESNQYNDSQEFQRHAVTEPHPLTVNRKHLPPEHTIEDGLGAWRYVGVPLDTTPPSLLPTPSTATAKSPVPPMSHPPRKRRLSSAQAQQLMTALSGIEWALCGLCLLLALPIAYLVLQGFSVRWLTPLVMAAILFCPLLYPINLTVKGVKLGLGMLVLVVGGVF